MAFEVFTREEVTAFPSNVDDLCVRFLFRNGSTEGEAPTVFPLFGGQDESLSYGDFVSNMAEFAIMSPEQWCVTCQSDVLFCQAYGARKDYSLATQNGSGLSNAVAGVIGALVTMGVVSLAGLIPFLMRRRRASAKAASPMRHEKGSISSQGSSV